jgi:hypothetical protein
MPTRRILVVMVGAVVLTDVVTHTLVRGWAARRVAEGRAGAFTQALLVI